MRMITRMLLASVLAIGAGSFAGCGNTDCPSTFTQGASCSSEGLSCTTSAESCACSGGHWVCAIDFGPEPIPDMAKPHDLANPSD